MQTERIREEELGVIFFDEAWVAPVGAKAWKSLCGVVVGTKGGQQREFASFAGGSVIKKNDPQLLYPDALMKYAGYTELARLQVSTRAFINSYSSFWAG